MSIDGTRQNERLEPDGKNKYYIVYTYTLKA